MGKTLVISEVISTKEVETEKKFLFIEYNSTTTFKYFYFKVQYPDNSEELFKWDVIEMTYTPEEEEDTLTEKKLKRDPDFIKRETTLQKVINKLEDEGFNAKVSQISLFFSERIDRLIMQK